MKRLLDLLNSRRTWIGLITGLLVLWALVYACSSNNAKRSDTYTIARNVSWYPLQLMNRERSLLGFVDDLMAAIAKEESFKYGWIETGPANLVEGLDSGSYDSVLTFLRPSVTNRFKYEFSNLIYETGPVLVVPESSTIRTLDDLDGKIIAISSGTAFVFSTAMKKPIETHYILQSFDNMSTALDALVNNQIDAVLMDVIPAHTYIQTFYPGKLKIATSPLTDEGLRLVALKNHYSAELIKKFNEGLKKLKEDGTYDSFLNKWQLVDPEQDHLDDEVKK